MSDPNQADGRVQKRDAIVEVTDETGRIVDRRSFETESEAEQYAAGEEAKGHNAKVSSLEPKPKGEI